MHCVKISVGTYWHIITAICEHFAILWQVQSKNQVCTETNKYRRNALLCNCVIFSLSGEDLRMWLYFIVCVTFGIANNVTTALSNFCQTRLSKSFGMCLSAVCRNDYNSCENAVITWLFEGAALAYRGSLTHNRQMISTLHVKSSP